VSAGTEVRRQHCCPNHCIDDLCVYSDQGLCGAYRCGDPLGWDADEDWPEDDDNEIR
jgi:hypothetical protein